MATVAPLWEPQEAQAEYLAGLKNVIREQQRFTAAVAFGQALIGDQHSDDAQALIEDAVGLADALIARLER